jgi:Na+-translocating ferredoxin:NAD+ oxidoreductase subunit G
MSARRGKARGGLRLFACLAFGVLLCPGSDVSAGGPATREEALAAAFPGAQIKPETIFLTERQMKEAAALAGVPIPSALVARYRAFLNGKIVGRAYVDTHVVRTKKESLLIVLDEYGVVRRIEVTAFLEPPQYQASSQWYAQYKGKGLNNDLNLQRGIRPVAGATLTALAANQAVRRVLAIDQVLGP